MRRRLFSESGLSDFIDGRLRASSEAVEGIPREQFANAAEEAVVSHVCSSHSIEALSVAFDAARLMTSESKMDVSQNALYNPERDPGPIYARSTEVAVAFPFTGDAHLFDLRPSATWGTYPKGEVSAANDMKSGEVRIYAEYLSGVDPEIIRQDTQARIANLRNYVEQQAIDLRDYANQLEALVRDAVRHRRELLKEQHRLATVIGIPLKAREGQPEFVALPLPRIRIRPLPAAPSRPVAPEPGIGEEDFRHITAVIRHMGRTFERAPETFAKFDEEGLRDIVLAGLNSHYQGEASAETFRKAGKTDILIEDSSRAAFIAECKIWRGPAELQKALTQLLGYATWRDCKVALVVFNQEVASFSTIFESAPKVLRGLPQYRDETPSDERGEWEVTVASIEDASREVRVRLMLFDLFVRSK